MPTWLKVVLGVIAAFVALFIVVIVVGVMWFKGHKGELVASGTRALKEGRTFGAQKARPDCIAEGFRRLGSVDGIGAEIQNNLFAKGCLEVASDTEGFCTDVPGTGEIMATVKWRASVCSSHNEVDPQRCQRFLQTWQEACHSRGAAKTK